MIIIKGAGDLASGTALRLWRCGYDIVMTDIENPTSIRRAVCFSEAVRLGMTQVEGVTALRAQSREEALLALKKGYIPVLPDPGAAIAGALHPAALVDAILAKVNTGTKITDAPLVIALGPGFAAGRDCHAVIETMRGHTLGRVITEGAAIPNTGIPGEVGGHSADRIIRACRDGIFIPLASIGDRVEKGQTVATVDGESVLANLSGILRGILPEGTKVCRDMKSGDVDPRCERKNCFTVSDKAMAVAGGVLEALLRNGILPNRAGKEE